MASLRFLFLPVAAFLLLLAGHVSAQSDVKFKSFPTGDTIRGGQSYMLSWTYTVDPRLSPARAPEVDVRIEWAASLSGPWSTSNFALSVTATSYTLTVPKDASSPFMIFSLYNNYDGKTTKSPNLYAYIKDAGGSATAATSPAATTPPRPTVETPSTTDLIETSVQTVEPTTIIDTTPTSNSPGSPQQTNAVTSTPANGASSAATPTPGAPAGSSDDQSASGASAGSSSSSSSSGGDSGGMSTAAKAGIGAGAAALGVAILIGLFFFLRRRRHKASADTPPVGPMLETGASEFPVSHNSKWAPDRKPDGRAELHSWGGVSPMSSPPPPHSADLPSWGGSPVSSAGSPPPQFGASELSDGGNVPNNGPYRAYNPGGRGPDSMFGRAEAP